MQTHLTANTLASVMKDSPAVIGTWFYGIDGCRDGWVVARGRPDVHQVHIEVVDNLQPVFARAGIDSIVAIDIPIGIPENQARVCDRAARQVLGARRSSSVFSPPCRKALHAQTYAEALCRNREAMGTGISKQAFHIMKKIREVDELITMERQRYVREVHPEVTFAQLNGRPLASKKSPDGRAERIALLQATGLSVSESWLIQQRIQLGRRRVVLDDMIDALACLVTAVAIGAGNSECLGQRGQTDGRGLAMEIVYRSPNIR